MAERSLELLKGTLDLLILQALVRGPAHGYTVMRWIEETTGSTLIVEEGSLYPALYRLEDRGWVPSELGRPEHHRRARFYRLTPKGKTHLKVEARDFVRFAEAVFQVLNGPTEALRRCRKVLAG